MQMPSIRDGILKSSAGKNLWSEAISRMTIFSAFNFEVSIAEAVRLFKKASQEERQKVL